jgi:hypothetical protein
MLNKIKNHFIAEEEGYSIMLSLAVFGLVVWVLSFFDVFDLEARSIEAQNILQGFAVAMGTKYKSGIPDITITRFAGGEDRGPCLHVARPKTQKAFSAVDILSNLNWDTIELTLEEAKQIGATLVTLSVPGGGTDLIVVDGES